MANRRRGCLANLFGLVAVCLIVVYVVVGVTSPWAFHIGGRSTPLLYWSGYGKLTTKNGSFPLYVIFYPSPHFSKLHLDGLRPTGGLQGTAHLCTSAGVAEPLKLSGTIYGGWSSTNEALMAFRLLEFRIVNMGQQQGYFDLYGRWSGPELMMTDRHRSSEKFRSGLKIDQATITLDWGSYAEFKTACANSTVTHPGN